MTKEENIKAILECNFAGFKEEIINIATKRICELEPCEDAVSRKAVRDTIFAECSDVKLGIDFAKVLLLQRAIKALPSVTPQEQFKPMVEIDLYSVINQKYIEREVLEKLKADIEAAYDELDGYDPDALGTFASRIDDLIDNLLSESEVKANENEK